VSVILVTGSAGFIGSHLVKRLLKLGYFVVGVDNQNDYYDPTLKEARLNQFIENDNYKHFRFDISDKEALRELFLEYSPTHVVNLAAQAGVRYSLENPGAYIQSNVVGFSNLLECSKNKVKHLVYASSSSVYGANLSMPFTEDQNISHPLSIYAATKAANELISHAYSHLYNLPTTGLRFFTVYGPWGRPDMALFKFTKSILAGESITLFNHGRHKRDFTYIDDVIDAIVKVLFAPAVSDPSWDGLKPNPSTSSAPWKLHNVASGNPISLDQFVEALEESLGIKANKKLVPMQPGDLPETFADIASLKDIIQFKPNTCIQDGVDQFVSWYKKYYKLNSI
jgi:UDP-glucuronate 4-epimerase